MILWKYILLQGKNNSKGFTIPLILGLGLFMLAIGITSIKLSSSSETNSKIQEKTQQSLAAAELGLVRIQELLDNNRTIAVYNDCAGTRVDGVCPDSDPDGDPSTDDGVPSWANPGAINQETQSGVSCLPIENEDDLIAIEAIASTTNWQDADPDNPGDGQFRLVEYTYQSNSGVDFEFPGVATLVVEGRSNQFEAGATDRDSEVLNTGTTRLAVEIPIRKNTTTFTTSTPGLWMEFSVFSNMGSNNVNGSILIEDANCAGNGDIPSNLGDQNLVDPYDEVTNPTGDQITASPQEMPDTPDLPPLNRLNKVQSVDLFDRGVEIPRPEDVSYDADGDGVVEYHYLIPSLEQAGGADLNISGNQTIVLYVQGPISFNGSINDRSSAGVDSGALQIYGNTVADPAGSGYDVGSNDGTYKYGCDQVEQTNGNLGNNTCPTRTIKLTGTADLNGFIHAPDAWACVTGGASDYAITGALWIEQWIAVGSSIGSIAPADVASELGNSCSTSDKNVIDFSGSSLPTSASNFLGVGEIQTYDEPQVSSLTSWRRIEITD